MPLPVTLELIALLARKWSLNNLLCSLDGIPMPVSSIITFQESLLSDTETLTLPFSGVYFSEFDKMFLELNPFSPYQTTHSNN